MFKHLFILCSLLSLSAVGAQAQIKTPQPSPSAKITQDVGLAKVEIEYSRPSSKGRKVFGDLVPFGEMWRTGANASTKITFSDDAKFGGQDVAKGTYALYSIPGEKEWRLILYKNTSFWGVPGKNYDENDVAAAVTVTPVALRDRVETFTIEIGNLRNNGADLMLSWENTRASAPITFDVDTKVEADIKNQLAGPSASTYYQAARYYLEEKKDMNKALEWINLSLEKGGEKFWIVRTKALILAEMGRYKEAIATAERSTELAKAEGNADYPRMNDKSIAEWKTKK
ncbi:MAG: DUF2911 domain-containing protein [Saprospiraceae bacterium]